jgi:hypothetical protein
MRIHRSIGFVFYDRITHQVIDVLTIMESGDAVGMLTYKRNEFQAELAKLYPEYQITSFFFTT